MADLGIRKEDKTPWERRAPLSPEQVGALVVRGLTIAVEPSPRRVFSDQEYVAAGAELRRDLASSKVILGVKEVPLDRLYPGRPHLFFAHVIKGQAYNMPLLAKLLELGCTLIDYEAIRDARGRRLIAFGRHAGYAGMIDTLWTLGRRLAWEGVPNPFTSVGQASTWRDLRQAEEAIGGPVARQIREEGVPEAVHPLVFGFTGSGRVSGGAQRIFDHLPHITVSPEDLPGLAERRGELSRRKVYKVRFGRGDRQHFAPFLEHLTVLVNGIYWEPGHPRLVRVEDVRRLWAGEGQPRLRVLADLSCDRQGSIEVTVRQTTPIDPVYVYDPATGEGVSGVEGVGPVVLAVEILPSELPRDSTEHFGERLTPYLPALAAADYSTPVEELALPPELRRAVITHRGRLAPDYLHLGEIFCELPL